MPKIFVSQVSVRENIFWVFCIFSWHARRFVCIFSKYNTFFFFWLTMTITENPILSSPNPLRNFYWEEYDIVICMKCISLHNWWWLYKSLFINPKREVLYKSLFYFSVRVCWSRPSWTAGGTRRTSSATRTAIRSASTTRTPSTASGRGCPSRLSIQ